MSRTKNTSKAPRGSPGNGRNRWTYEQRVCLHLLWTHDRRPSISERTRAFNSIYEGHLASCGVPAPGLKAATISAQYGELAIDKPTWKNTWGNVRDAPDTDEDRALRARLAAQIDEILQQGAGPDVVLQQGAVWDDVVVDLNTPPVTPRRTERARTVTQSPYVAYAIDDPAFGDTINVATSPETPRRTERARKPTQNPYTPYTADDPTTPVRSQGVRAQVSANFEPYATPGPSARKRPAAVASDLFIDGDSGDELNAAEHVPRAKRVMRSSPTVQIPPSPETALIRTIHTPVQSRYRAGGREGANMLWTNPNGRGIMLKPKEHEEARQPMKNVTEEKAHPQPPALLFRYWHGKSHGINSKEGFVSGKYMPSNLLVEPRGPPDCATMDMNDVAHHLNNRGTDQDGIPSPFISTANCLAWCARMALKRMDLGANLTVIDPSELDPKALYYVPPFYEVLKKKRCFERGYFGYRGTHEHLVYREIPRSAIVKTFSVEELIAFTNSDRDVKRVLRLDIMAVAKTPASEIIKALKQGNLTVNSRVAAAIGKIVLFLGLNHKSSREMLSRAVFEVTQGWALKPDGESQEEEKANCFVKQFQDKSAAYVDIKDQLKLKHAFLHGMQWSCGDLNVHLKGQAGYDTMKDRARKRGLVEPGTLLINELNKEKREIALFVQQQRELHCGPPQALQVQNQGHEAQMNEADGEVIVPRQFGRLNLEEYIHYEGEME